jgi:hypothetical protein
VLFSPFTSAIVIYLDNRGLLDFGRPPSVEEQLEDIQQAAATSGRRVSLFQELRLHQATSSYLMILAEQDPNLLAPDARSDEIRIYDRVGDYLRLRFRFNPEPRVTEGSTDFSYPYLFRFDTATDVDGDGLVELLGSYVQQWADSSFFAPIVVDWDARSGEYRLLSVLARKPSLVLDGNRGLYGRAVRRIYAEDALLTDVRNGTEYASRVVDEYAWAPGDRSGFGGAILLTAYTVHADCNACPRTRQVVAWDYQLTWPNPQVYDLCKSGFCRPAMLIEQVVPGLSDTRQIMTIWRERTS